MPTLLHLASKHLFSINVWNKHILIHNLESTAKNGIKNNFVYSLGIESSGFLTAPSIDSITHLSQTFIAE